MGLPPLLLMALIYLVIAGLLLVFAITDVDKALFRKMEDFFFQRKQVKIEPARGQVWKLLFGLKLFVDDVEPDGTVRWHVCAPGDFSKAASSCGKSPRHLWKKRVKLLKMRLIYHPGGRDGRRQLS